MDTSETAVHTLAAVEANIHESKETDAMRIIRGEGVEKCPKWTRPLVELRSLAYEPSLRYILLLETGTALHSSTSFTAFNLDVNRRVRNRTHGGVGGRRE